MVVAHLLRGTSARDERGASAVEYGLLVVAIAALIVVVVFALGGVVVELFGTTCDNVKTASSISGSCSR